MDITAASSVAATSSTESEEVVTATPEEMGLTTGSAGGELGKDEFLTLLITQMQNQDPLEPTDNSDYMAQLATFTQVEATKEMNDNTLQDMASNLVGKQVIMTTTQNSNGYIGGTVDYWETINGTVYLGIGGKLYDIADLDTVMDKDYFDKWKGNGSTTDTKTEDTKPGE